MDDLLRTLKLELESAVNTGDREAVLTLIKILSVLEE